MLNSLNSATETNSAIIPACEPETNNSISADRLVLSHQQLVRRIAWQVHSRMSAAIEIEDLIQIGLIALVEAANSFEDRGFAFATYATMRIRGSMIDALRKDARICRSGMSNRRKLSAVRDQLTRDLMRNPTDAEMMAALEMNADEYFAMVASSQTVQQDSIDLHYDDHQSWFADTTERADEVIEQDQEKALLISKLDKLAERQKMVLSLYFVEEMSLEEIGLALGVGAARVCQIKKAALDKLRTLVAN